jgi:hypothetical protein
MRLTFFVTAADHLIAKEFALMRFTFLLRFRHFHSFAEGLSG